MALYQWSTTPATNATAGSINWAEGQAPSTVNDSARQLMADVATYMADPQFYNFGNTPTYVSTTSFTVTGDQTATYAAHRRIKCTVTAGTVYGTISSSSFSTVTTVNVTLDSGSLDSGLSKVELGILTGTHNAIPDNIVASTSTTAALGTNSTAIATTAFAQANQRSKIHSVAASVNGTGGAPANGMLLTLNATTLDFRSATPTDGTVNTRTVASPISLTISSGSTLGTVNATAARIVILAIDNAGTVELAAVNLAGGNNLDETTLINTTAEGGAGGADSANVIYSTTARTGVPFRVVGFVDITEAAAGTWATAPTLVQGAGGNAATSMQSLGYGVPSDLAIPASRASGTVYYNTTGKPIEVSVTSSATTSVLLSVTLGAISNYQSSQFNGSLNGIALVSFTVPPGLGYSVSVSGSGTIAKWTEL